MKIKMAKPVNSTQEEFQRLCELGGGQAGGPVKHKVIDLLRDRGKKLNHNAYQVAKQHFDPAPVSRTPG